MCIPRCCSLDGDADRLVFFTIQGGAAEKAGGSASIELLDGDKIATLAAVYIGDLLQQLSEEVKAGVKVTFGCTLNLNLDPAWPPSPRLHPIPPFPFGVIQPYLLPSHSPPTLQVGVIQTAYANGASTTFTQDKLGLKVECTPTGEWMFTGIGSTDHCSHICELFILPPLTSLTQV